MTDWLVSFHGGHSGDFCNHATGSLESVVEAAIACGMRAFGVTEHMPPSRDQDRYDDEIAAGLTVSEMQARFRRYATDVFPELRERYGDRIDLVLGMEIEVVPHAEYPRIVGELRESLCIEYVVGSVHHVNGRCFDESEAGYAALVDEAGGVNELFLRYYQIQAEMLEAVRPEVVGHLDLIRKFAPRDHVPSDEVREAARANLERIAAYGGVIEVNARAFGRWDEPYPGRELLAEARRCGVAATLGDDSHGPEQVGEGLDRCRSFLVEAGYETLVSWRSEDGRLVRRDVSLN